MPAASPQVVYESDVAPTIPPAPGSTFGLLDETAVPTLPPGAVTAEETVLEPEAVVEPPPGRVLADPDEQPGPQPVPELRLPFEEPRAEETPSPTAPVAEPVGAQAPEPAATPFSSSTLAELYLKQGLVDQAVEVYRRLLAGEPGNARARARLAEIERMPSPEAARGARRQALERTIAGLEALLAVVQRR
jgi:hypothetical protein